MKSIREYQLWCIMAGVTAFNYHQNYGMTQSTALGVVNKVAREKREQLGLPEWVNNIPYLIGENNA